MTRKETGAVDVTLDLMAIQSNALEAIRDYGHYLRDAENAGPPEVAYFVRQIMEEDSAALLTSGATEKAGQRQQGRCAQIFWFCTSSALPTGLPDRNLN